MHVLTKVFIVLVSLMAVLLVPLVVVYAHNEDSYKAKYQEATARAETANRQRESVLAASQQERAQAELDSQLLEQEKGVLQRAVDQQVAQIRQLKTQFAEASSSQGQMQAQLATIASAVDAGGKLTDSLITELRDLRTNALDSQQQVVELDAALRDVMAQLDVAVAARRALQEELQRLKDEHARALDTIGRYVAAHGELRGDMVAAGELRPDRDVEASVVNITRKQGQTLVEIDAGSRDGVKQGWGMTIHRGGTFLGKLRVVEVDIDRSVGELSLERSNQRVQQGDVVSASAR